MSSRGRGGKEVVSVVVKRGDQETRTAVTFLPGGQVQVHTLTDICIDCGEVVDDYYMVKDGVWVDEAKLGKQDGHMHIACLEKKIGRPLVLGDFTAARCNEPIRSGYRIGYRAGRWPEEGDADAGP